MFRSKIDIFKVMEYASKGSLLDLLRTEKSNLELKDLLKL